MNNQDCLNIIKKYIDNYKSLYYYNIFICNFKPDYNSFFNELLYNIIKLIKNISTQCSICNRCYINFNSINTNIYYISNKYQIEYVYNTNYIKNNQISFYIDDFRCSFINNIKHTFLYATNLKYIDVIYYISKSNLSSKYNVYICNNY